MHIGTRLGQTIPAQISIYRDIASNISIRTNCNNLAIIRRRLIDPDLIDIDTNVSANYILNIYELKSGIAVQANVDVAEQRQRNTESAIDVTVNVASDETRERNTQSAIDITTDVLADLVRTLEMQSDISISTDVDLSEVRVRLARSDIDVDTTVSAVLNIAALLFGYDGDIGPGDTVIIDTDELTVEKADGTNLRKYFDGEWYKIDPETTDNLSYSDTEGSRDIEFVIEKENRSI